MWRGTKVWFFLWKTTEKNSQHFTLKELHFMVSIYLPFWIISIILSDKICSLWVRWENVQGSGSRKCKGPEVSMCLVVEGTARRHVWVECTGGDHRIWECGGDEVRAIAGRQILQDPRYHLCHFCTIAMFLCLFYLKFCNWFFFWFHFLLLYELRILYEDLWIFRRHFPFSSNLVFLCLHLSPGEITMLDNF